MSTKIEKVPDFGAQFRIADWLVDPGLNRISRGGTVVQLESKAMDVLVFLAGRAGELVDKRDLQDAVWQTEFVSYNTLTGRISELREAFEDDARNPRYIETIPKRGYRLIAEVSLGPLPKAEGGALAGTGQERADERSPYPGLASFSESDSEDFFGREAEIAALWRKITARRLLAVIGASGAGKSSLVRAGIAARAPAGWRAVVCQPGEDPFLAVARALAPDVVGDAEDMRRLLAFHDLDVALAVAARWRGRWDEALLVVDQFEELFTLSPEPMRERFAELLRRLVDAAGIHVVLVLRDDFLLDCYRHRELEPIFSDLTPVGPPAGKELRQALTEPAGRRLYGFESESMVDEMVAEVEAERGALPLLAFAVSRLWELRNRERRLLTREAYERIGGVSGALAQHAEATLEAIGEGRLPVVRELFRNLVTAQGTRAVRDVGELVSVFADSQRQSAAEVLRALIDARLLTSFQEEAPDQASTGARHRVEILHESLLKAWPRLVRWQTQDADAAQLRDQLRQAARTWDEHERTDDMLWTGSAFREYAVWRERYQGGLSELEEAFAAAMSSLATRRRRRRRIATAAIVVALAAVAIVLFTLWRRSVHETRRAEAAKLLALAQARVVDDPTEALALTTASLEVADSREAREFVMRALWAAPPALELEVETAMERREVSFSPGGRHVAVAGNVPEVRVWADDGQGPIRLGGHLMNPPNMALWADDDLVVTSDVEEAGSWLPFADRTKVWSIPNGTLLRTVELASPAYWKVGPRRLFAQIEHDEAAQRRIELRSWRLPDGPEELLDSLSPAALAGISDLVAAPDGSGWVVTRGRELFFRPFGGGGSERLLEVLDAEAHAVPYGAESVLVEDQTGNLRLWSFRGEQPRQSWSIRRPAAATNSLPDWQGRRVARLSPDRQSVQVWELGGLPGASPLELRRSGHWYDPNFACHPEGTWCAATTHVEKRLTLWPLARPYPSVLEGFKFPRYRKPLTFSPDSQWLAVGWEEGVRLLPVRGGDPGAVRDLSVPIGASSSDFRFDREGRFLLVVSLGDAWVVPLGGGPARLMVPAVDHRQIEQGAISPSGKRVASAYFIGQGPFELYVVDVATGARMAFNLPWIQNVSERATGVISLEFLDEQTLLTMGGGGLRRWDLATGEQETMVANDGGRWMKASPSAGLAVAWCLGASLAPQLELIDLAAWTSRPLPGFEGDVEWADLDPSGTVVAAGSSDGTIRIARVDGGEHHLLLGHTGNVKYLAISPDLRWVASAGDDNTVRLWPMPDLSKPPLHTLPHDELIAKLHSLTNLRAVRDPSSDTGWTIELGPFPGWAEVPEWNP